jgi:CubicO group peptidase (beta-lactamase class C family)
MTGDEGDATMTEIHGECDPRFGAVEAAFEANFAGGGEQGASVAVTLHGEPVVDLWAGRADGGANDTGDADPDATEQPWERDTIVNVWSTTKTMAATCMLILADRGDVDIDKPIATYWPEFASHGKDGVTLAHVLGHTAGLPGWAPPIEPEVLLDHDRAVAALIDQPTWWEPGTASGYHAVSQGFLENEIVRRVTGRTLGTFFREEVAGPLGADFHIGLPESEDGRVAEIIPPGPEAMAEAAAAAGVDESSVAARALLSCPLTGSEPNTRAWRAAEIPAAGGTGNARSVARVHSALANGGTVDGVTLLTPEGVERIFVEQCHQVDQVLNVKLRLGTGFGLMNETVPLSPNPRACFWGGWGGSVAVVDLDAHLSFAYVMNRMAGGLVGDIRGAMLALATYQSIGAFG